MTTTAMDDVRGNGLPEPWVELVYRPEEGRWYVALCNAMLPLDERAAEQIGDFIAAGDTSRFHVAGFTCEEGRVTGLLTEHTVRLEFMLAEEALARDAGVG